MPQIKSKILYNHKAPGGCFHLILEAAKINKQAKPGNFVNIRVNAGSEPLLRRPFSIHGAKGKSLEILYQVVGRGTEILARKNPGEYLDVIGPLGNGFDLKPQSRKAAKQAVLVAGGMGVAPLAFLAEKSAKCEVKAKNTKLKTLVLIGAKTKTSVLCEGEFRKFGCEVKIATDDGSRGFKGYVSELLKNLLLTTNYQLSTIYACGPKPMLKEIAFISRRHNIPAQISLEEHMACGIGACLGCVVNTRQGFKRVCKEGPVFNAEEIIW